MQAAIRRHLQQLSKLHRLLPKLKQGQVGVGVRSRLNVCLDLHSTRERSANADFGAVHKCASLDDLELFSDEQDDLASSVLENSHQLTYDTEGRIILPSAVLKHANINSEAIFVGRGKRFQIWEPTAYELHSSQSFSRAKKKGVTLPLRSETGGESA